MAEVNEPSGLIQTVGLKEIKQALGWKSDTTVYDYMASRGFPRPIKGSRRCARWLVTEVNAWIAQRAADR